MSGSLPDWVFPTIFVVTGLGAYCGIALRNTRKLIARTRARRPNPTRDEFVALMHGQVSADTALFLWDTMLDYLQPELTPHPDDHLYRDLPIDDDDPAMDWLPRFAEQHGMHWRSWPEWPKDWDGTVGNFARWLELGINQRA